MDKYIGAILIHDNKSVVFSLIKELQLSGVSWIVCTLVTLILDWLRGIFDKMEISKMIMTSLLVGDIWRSVSIIALVSWMELVMLLMVVILVNIMLFVVRLGDSAVHSVILVIFPSASDLAKLLYD